MLLKQRDKICEADTARSRARAGTNRGKEASVWRGMAAFQFVETAWLTYASRNLLTNGGCSSKFSSETHGKASRQGDSGSREETGEVDQIEAARIGHDHEQFSGVALPELRDGP